MNILVGLPAWGDEAVARAQAFVLPSLRAAWEAAGPEEIRPRFRFVVHTDRPQAFANLVNMFPGCVVRICPMPADPATTELYDLYGRCQADELARAHPGDVVMLVAADLVFSIETIHFVRQQITEWPCIVSAVPRCELLGPVQPIGFAGPDLGAWARSHKHAWTKELHRGHGRATDHPSVTFTDDEDGFRARAHHMHPVAVRVTRPLWFSRGTADLDLVDRFRSDEILIVARPEQMAMVEVSPPDKMPKVGTETLTDAVVEAWADRWGASAHHRWFARHEVLISA